jgi:hypothetical protein
MRTFYEWAGMKRCLRQPLDILARSVPTEDGAIGKFRQLVLDRLGDLAVLVLNVRLAGGSAMSFVGSPVVGSPSRREVEEAVRGIRDLARRRFAATHEPVLLRIQRAMEEEADELKRARESDAEPYPADRH